MSGEITTYYDLIIDSAFRILDLRIHFPLSFDGTEFVDCPLYVFFIMEFIVSLILVFWAGTMYSNNDIE